MPHVVAHVSGFAGVLEQLELVVCLESLAGGSSLYLHTSKPAKTPAVLNVYNVRPRSRVSCLRLLSRRPVLQTFRDTARALNIPFTLLQHKINVSSSVVNWEHERFGRKRIRTRRSRDSPRHKS
jgi:hypothetical protein